MNGGGAFSALIFVVGILIAFAVMFGLFLVVPFFIFLAGIVVMLVSERRRGDGETKRATPAETDKAAGSTPVRKGKS